MPTPLVGAYELLLLPALAYPITYHSIKSQYYGPLCTVLHSHRDQSQQIRIVVDIALPCPHLSALPSSPRNALYSETQDAVANVYKLICIIAAEERIEVADIDGEGVDTRIIVLPWHSDRVVRPARGISFGPVVTIEDLAMSKRSWHTVWAVNATSGRSVLDKFQQYCDHPRHHLKFIDSSESNSQSPTHEIHGAGRQDSHRSSAKTVELRHVAVGGTFDHLHMGHKLLLTMTSFVVDPQTTASSPTIDRAAQRAQVTVGITAEDLLANKKHADFLQDWQTRAERTNAFLRGILCFDKTLAGSIDPYAKINGREERRPGPNGHAITTRFGPEDGLQLEVKYVEIWDAYGPTITDASIDSLVVSGETRDGGAMVNEKRQELGMRALEVFEVAVLDAGDERAAKSEGAASFESKISSTEIRRMQSEKAGRLSSRA